MCLNKELKQPFAVGRVLTPSSCFIALGSESNTASKSTFLDVGKTAEAAVLREVLHKPTS